MLECGCRPVRALAVLAELVGPSGKVVGIDFSEPAVQRARSVVATLGLDNVQVFAGDVHDVNVATLGGPFDLAYTRLFLMHQSDGGAHPPADLSPASPWWLDHRAGAAPSPSPAVESGPLDALGTGWELLH